MVVEVDRRLVQLAQSEDYETISEVFGRSTWQGQRDQFGDDVGPEKGEGVEERESGEGDDGDCELELMLF